MLDQLLLWKSYCLSNLLEKPGFGYGTHHSDHPIGEREESRGSVRTVARLMPQM